MTAAVHAPLLDDIGKAIVEQLQADILPTGVNHVIAALTDPALVRLFTGRDITGVLDVKGQLELIADRMMPALD